MASFSKIIMLANLTRDPESRVTPTGMSICKFGLATNRKFKSKDGQDREEVCFVDVDAFGKQAEAIQKYFRKGDPILIEGRLKLEKWQTDGGENRSKHGIVLETFTFVKGHGGDDNGGGQQRSASPPKQQASANDDPDEDIQF
jgi:single-strand DNA-binding protein